MYWGFHEEMVRDRERQLARDLQRSALRRESRRSVPAPADPVVLRLCRVQDDDDLSRLAALSGERSAPGRHVVAEVDGVVVAALPLAGGPALRDPFRRTAHLLPLLELRARQLAGRRPRRLPLGLWWTCRDAVAP
jgi:hypothetical protein